ncbi:MAG: 50S ribosomal protein L15 [Anaerolineae bacterium]|nr:50S ribosomal protein L15 [Anaerolineae bacterium]MCB9132796.1 50S ribosomal protein L15 [Anaerolineales bacterium]MCB0227612.1 50S ribosomal protein L15 [Anaerolineae bacterium]MCB0232735.1 50S ribosomal protein L15 [Anaerolineae bacterium]MCB0238285.1 50S ribosomal protein L15 [Anaerolineae bacterium]
MRLHDLGPAEGSKKSRKRVGRGIAAGQGKTAGRGTKGQNSRSGGGVRPYFEGGQLPLVRRLPHLRGFTNIWRVEFQPVNLARLADFAADSEVSPETLASAGIIKKATDRVAILADGEIDRPLNVKAHRVSKNAQSKIKAAGGTVEIIEAN